MEFVRMSDTSNYWDPTHFTWRYDFTSLVTHQRYCELDCVISTLHLHDGYHQQKDVVKLLSEELGDSTTKSMWKDCIDKAISHCFNSIAVVNYTKQPRRV